MTPHHRLILGIVAGAAILAIVALLVSGSFAASAAPSGAPVLGEGSTPHPSSNDEAYARALRGAPHGVLSVVRDLPTGLPAPSGAVGSALIGGWATYFDTCAGCAAAGPALREALGSKWRGTDLAVCTPVACVDVVLTDWCGCGQRHGKPTLIDLDRESFARLAPVSEGIVAVSIELPIELPRTDTDLRMQREVLGDELYR